MKAAARLQKQGRLEVQFAKWDGSTEEELAAINRVGFLIDSYKPEFWWFEVSACV